MKTKDFQDALTNVDDKYIEESAVYRRPSKALKVWRTIAIAACCVLTVSVIALIAALWPAGSKNSQGGSAYLSETGASPAVPIAGSGDYNYSSGYGVPAAEEKTDMMVSDEAVWEQELSESYGMAEQPAASDSGISDAKIIYTSSITMESAQFDECVDTIDRLVEASGGYYDSRTVSESSGSYRSASFRIRVPQGGYNSLIKDLEDAGTVTYQYQEAQDVSDYYYDIASRLNTARTKLERLQALLAKAELLEDIITLEDAISETEWEIDDLQGTLNGLDSKIRYSTITISLREVYRVNETVIPKTFGEKISAAFHDGLNSFGEAMEDLALWFAENWLWLLFIIAVHAVVFLIIFFMIRGIIRRNRKKRKV